MSTKIHQDLASGTENRLFIGGLELIPADRRSYWHVPGQTVMSTAELEKRLGSPGVIRTVTVRT